MKVYFWPQKHRTETKTVLNSAGIMLPTMFKIKKKLSTAIKTDENLLAEGGKKYIYLEYTW